MRYCVCDLEPTHAQSYMTRSKRLEKPSHSVTKRQYVKSMCKANAGVEPLQDAILAAPSGREVN